MLQLTSLNRLGVPFNIAFYSTLTHILAQITGKVAKEFIHVIGDAHVYVDHAEPLKTQLERTPYPFPKLTFSKPFSSLEEAEQLEFVDFIVDGYKCHASIPMKMST